ncbi:ferredoxin [Streptomyces sp. NPDC001351]|uniref:ferredoxin n=1 Tax=Streptomyces sp. NPDC001351 TaxID=3364564 RepID=UPI00369F1A17
MKVLVDHTRCQGYGNCVVAEPQVFDLDNDGFVQLQRQDPPEELRAGVRDAVRACPARALDLED